MRVLQVHNRYRLRGGEDAVVDATMALLAEKGVEARLFTRDSEGMHGLAAKIGSVFTAVYSRDTLLDMIARAGLDVVEWLPWGAFPAYFYLFAGMAFKILKGRGLNLSRAVYPYFAGELLLSPLLLFEKQLNLAMQTVIVQRRA